MKTLEKKLADLIERVQRRKLPTIVELSLLWGVGRNEIRRLISGHVDDGILEVAPGRGIRVRGKPMSVDRESSPNRLADRFRMRITQGDYPINDRIPKASTLAEQEHVSRSTVHKALQALSAEGLIDKIGKFYYVGGARKPIEVPLKFQNKRIIIVQPHMTYWQQLASEKWLRPFQSAFLKELRGYQVKTEIVVVGRGHRDRGISGVPTGVPGLRRKLSADREKVLGVLVVGTEQLVQSDNGTPLLVWIRELRRFGIPVIWFDQLDEIEYRRDRAETQKRFLTIREKSEYASFFTVLRSNEKKAIHLALQSLSQWGHRVIGLPLMPEVRADDWPVMRAGTIMDIARREFPHLRVVHPAELPHSDQLLHAGTVEDFHSMIHTFTEASSRLLIQALADIDAAGEDGGVRESGEIEVRALFMLARYLEVGTCTAILALNDRRAQRFLKLLRRLGREVPDDLSLLSFDDSPEDTYPYSISSVNFGFEELGQTAFRTMLLHSPDRRRFVRVLDSTPRINHHGSVRKIQSKEG